MDPKTALGIRAQLEGIAQVGKVGRSHRLAGAVCGDQEWSVVSAARRRAGIGSGPASRTRSPGLRA